MRFSNKRHIMNAQTKLETRTPTYLFGTSSLASSSGFGGEAYAGYSQGRSSNFIDFFAVAAGIEGCKFGGEMARHALSSAIISHTQGKELDSVMMAAEQGVRRCRKSIQLVHYPSKPYPLPREGCSLLVAKIEKQLVQLAWKGDIGAFLIKDNDIVPLIAPHCRNNGFLTRAVGFNNLTERTSAQIGGAQTLLLCTRSIWNTVKLNDISLELSRDCPHQSAKQIIKLASGLTNQSAAVVVVRLYNSC